MSSQHQSSGYVGRFAPSPTGALHAGSLVAAMASYLDARAHHGEWLVRIEDVDQTRTVPGAAESILETLARFGMQPDGEVLWQSRRTDLYGAAFDRLKAHVYPCGCSRREIADSNARAGMGAVTGTTIDAASGAAQSPLAYPGTCRHGMPPGRSARAWRVRVPAVGTQENCIGFQDRACGWQMQNLAVEAGDFVLRRADGFWAYQLAVVVDDAAQGVTHVVRGLDLLDSTPRQIHLQRLLGLATPHYLHAPLARNAQGEKLSKQTGATALDPDRVVAALGAAAQVLGLTVEGSTSPEDFWRRAIALWAAWFAD